LQYPVGFGFFQAVMMLAFGKGLLDLANVGGLTGKYRLGISAYSFNRLLRRNSCLNKCRYQ
jgi:hypothetical protein